MPVRPVPARPLTNRVAGKGKGRRRRQKKVPPARSAALRSQPPNARSRKSRCASQREPTSVTPPHRPFHGKPRVCCSLASAASFSVSPAAETRWRAAFTASPRSHRRQQPQARTAPLRCVLSEAHAGSPRPRVRRVSVATKSGMQRQRYEQRLGTRLPLRHASYRTVTSTHATPFAAKPASCPSAAATARSMPPPPSASRAAQRSRFHAPACAKLKPNREAARYATAGNGCRHESPSARPPDNGDSV
jgi:hypothetical protein